MCLAPLGKHLFCWLRSTYARVFTVPAVHDSPMHHSRSNAVSARTLHTTLTVHRVFLSASTGERTREREKEGGGGARRAQI